MPKTICLYEFYTFHYNPPTSKKHICKFANIGQLPIFLIKLFMSYGNIAY